KCVRWFCLFWGFHYYRHQCLNIELWNWFLVLSCLSATTRLPIAGAAETHGMTISDVRELQSSLKTLKSTIEDNCIFKFMHCYLLELEVILIEDMQVTVDYHEETKTNIYHLKKKLEEHQYNRSSCSPCEAQRVANTTIFLQNLEDLLKRIGNTVS
ncbi:unnamed protein product, partial [Coregonus sp. 'balchen']